MKNYYKISEFAALCGLSRDTLLHYDRIGILKPAFVAPSGYRYYTLSQFTTVDLIAVLKASGTPLSEIRGYLQNADVSAGIRLLEGKVQDLRARRAEIDRMIQSLEQTLEDMREGEQCVCGRLQLVQQRERYLIATPPATDARPANASLPAPCRLILPPVSSAALGSGFRPARSSPASGHWKGAFWRLIISARCPARWSTPICGSAPPAAGRCITTGAATTSCPMPTPSFWPRLPGRGCGWRGTCTSRT